MPLQDVRWLELPTVADERGMLTFAQIDQPLPFPIARIFYMYGVPTDLTRGGHAHKQCQQIVLAMHGSFRLKLDDGARQQEYLMNDRSRALLIPEMIWDELYDFSEGAVCLVLASMPYDEADYIRDYNEFDRLVNRNGTRD